jgi:hypothetical protein
MGQWGFETSAGDSVHDYLQHIQVDTSKFRQFDVKPLLDYTWSDVQVTDRDKLGVVMHLLTHELTVPKDKLQEVLKIAKLELLSKNLKSWSEPEERTKMVVIEIQDIRVAIGNGGKGRARHAKGLLEKMADMSEEDDNKVEDTLNAGETTIKHPSKEKTIKLPCYGIVVELTDLELHAITPNRYNGGSISSDMQETCSYCEDADCDMGCTDFFEHCSDRDFGVQLTKQAERYEFLCHRAAVDALESIILGHACAGIDISTPAYIEGIETAVQALTNADYSVEI